MYTSRSSIRLLGSFILFCMTMSMAYAQTDLAAGGLLQKIQERLASEKKASSQLLSVTCRPVNSCCGMRERYSMPPAP